MKKHLYKQIYELRIINVESRIAPPLHHSKRVKRRISHLFTLSPLIHLFTLSLLSAHPSRAQPTASVSGQCCKPTHRACSCQSLWSCR